MRQVFGPYPHGNRWRLVVEEDGRQQAVSFETKDEALAQLDIEDRKRRDAAAVTLLLATAIPMPSAPTWVYLLHNEAGEIIYVGSATDVGDRLKGHEQPHARASILPKPFTRGEALQLEAALIRTLQPRGNRQHAGNFSMGAVTSGAD